MFGKLLESVDHKSRDTLTGSLYKNETFIGASVRTPLTYWLVKGPKMCIREKNKQLLLVLSKQALNLHSTLEGMVIAWHIGHDLPLIGFIGVQKICKVHFLFKKYFPKWKFTNSPSASNIFGMSRYRSAISNAKFRFSRGLSWKQNKVQNIFI